MQETKTAALSKGFGLSAFYNRPKSIYPTVSSHFHFQVNIPCRRGNKGDHSVSQLHVDKRSRQDEREHSNGLINIKSKTPIPKLVLYIISHVCYTKEPLTGTHGVIPSVFLHFSGLYSEHQLKSKHLDNMGESPNVHLFTHGPSWKTPSLSAFVTYSSHNYRNLFYSLICR